MRILLKMWLREFLKIRAQQVKLYGLLEKKWNFELFVSHDSSIELHKSVNEVFFTRETEIWILSRDYCDDSSVVFENMQRLCVRHDHGRLAEAIEPRLWACVTSLSTCRWSRRTCMAVYFVIMFKKSVYFRVLCIRILLSNLIDGNNVAIRIQLNEEKARMRFDTNFSTNGNFTDLAWNLKDGVNRVFYKNQTRNQTIGMKDLLRNDQPDEWNEWNERETYE